MPVRNDLSLALTVWAKPMLFSITPSAVTMAGGRVLLEGINLRPELEVFVGGFKCEDVVLVVAADADADTDAQLEGGGGGDAALEKGEEEDQFLACTAPVHKPGPQKLEVGAPAGNWTSAFYVDLGVAMCVCACVRRVVCVCVLRVVCVCACVCVRPVQPSLASTAAVCLPPGCRERTTAVSTTERRVAQVR